MASVYINFTFTKIALSCITKLPMKKLLIFIFLAVGCLTLVPSCTSKGKSHVVLHPNKTGITTVRFHDQNRDRPLVTEVWYPVDEESPCDHVEGLWVRCAEARDA